MPRHLSLRRCLQLSLVFGFGNRLLPCIRKNYSNFLPSHGLDEERSSEAKPVAQKVRVVTSTLNSQFIFGKT